MKRALLSFPFLFLLTAILCGQSNILTSPNQGILHDKRNTKTGFIKNKGQIIDQNNNPNPAVLYLLNTPGMNVQLRKGGFSYDLYSLTAFPSLLGEGSGVGSPSSSERSLGRSSSRHVSRVTRLDSIFHHPSSIIQFHRIDINLENANLDCQVIPSESLTDYSNYFTANTPPEGIKNVRQYSKITYKDIYPDIDLEFFTTGEHGYEYNFVIYPGGNINDIRLSIAGPDLISLMQDTLKFNTRFGEMEELIPESYYLADNSKVELQTQFIKTTNNHYGFSINQTIPEASEIIIDPTSIRLWGTYYGGALGDFGFGCAVDKSGNVFMAGGAYSLTNIASSGSFKDTLTGNEDAFLAKFNAAGQRLWGTYVGGTQLDEARSCVVDKSGNIYISGYTTSTSGIASPGAHQTVYGGGNQDCFIEKFTQDGVRLWGTYYGGADDDETETIATDNNRNVFFTGGTMSDTGISTPGCYQQNRNGIGSNAFLAKFDSSGVRQWGTYYGGDHDDEGVECSIDGLGNIYIAGDATSFTHIASPGAYQTTYGGGGCDAFLAKFTTGGHRIWATYYGGSKEDRGWAGCSADSIGNVCFGGQTSSTNGIASPGCSQPLFGGGLYDAYIVRFDSSGQRTWGTYVGGTLYDAGIACTFGWNDDVFFGGYTESTTGISTPNSYQPAIDGVMNGFLVKFNASGKRQWGTYYGGSAAESIFNCTYVADDTIYMAGEGESPNNIASPGAWQDTVGGLAYDAILIKFLDCWAIDTAGSITGPITNCKPSTGLIFSIPSLPHAANYNWILPAGFTITGGSGTNSITVDISVSASSGWIKVNGINKCGDPGGSDSLFITLNMPPVPVIFGPNITCAGTGKVYTTAAGQSNYQWSISAGGLITSGGISTDNTVTVTWNIPGTQHVYVNYSDLNGCMGSVPADYNVTVTASPVVSVSVSTPSNTVCSGTSVTFTATPINGGGVPSYQWIVNGIHTGSGLSTYSYFPLNNDAISCVLTSSITGCIMHNPDTSNTIIMAVTPNLPVSVSVTASQNPVCAGTSVTFTATPGNGGPSPSYQWKVNGTGVGTNSTTYSYTPVNGDLVSCVLTSSELCTTNNPALSIPYTVSVSPLLPVSITISPSQNPFCLGSPVTFTAMPGNGGGLPAYQWKVNGMSVGPNSSSYTYNPANGDLVSCVLTSSATCISGNPASSNNITMNAILGIAAGVTIGASSNPFCPGTSVTFTANPTNGGASPAYQWKVNGANVGTNSPTYSYNPANGDSIRCVMTSNMACVTGNPASSAEIIMSGTLASVVTFTSCFDTITAINAKPIRLKGGIPLGGIYSGPGVNSGTGLFTPSIAGTGTKTITYTYTNAALCSSSKNIHVIVQPSAAFNCGNNLIDIRDNTSYTTIKIGSQCWLAKNLNYGTVIASSQDQRDNCMPEKYCYQDNPINCGTQGGLYQWDKLMQFDNTPADQGLCPAAWHIPTENDWNTLFANYINNGFAGSPLKYSGFSGFNALLYGARHINSGWDFNGFATFFWSSTSYGGYKAWAHGLNESDPSVSAYPANRVNAFSVRCVED